MKNLAPRDDSKDIPNKEDVESAAYTHPTTPGNKHIPAGGKSGQILRWGSDGTAAWGDEKDTTYGAATTTTSGLMSAADKDKLDGIEAKANNFTYTHPTTAGNIHLPAGGSANNVLVWSSAGTGKWEAGYIVKSDSNGLYIEK